MSEGERLGAFEGDMDALHYLEEASQEGFITTLDEEASKQKVQLKSDHEKLFKNIVPPIPTFELSVEQIKKIRVFDEGHLRLQVSLSKAIPPPDDEKSFSFVSLDPSAVRRELRKQWFPTFLLRHSGKTFRSTSLNECIQQALSCCAPQGKHLA